jgi:hypothetical protein
MSLTDRYAGRQAGDNDNYSCPNYSQVAGSKRCAHYLEGGACAREDEFMCIEWLRLNHPDNPLMMKTEAATARTDLFGNPTPNEPPAQSRPEELPVAPAPTPEPEKEREPPIVRNVTDEEIVSFKALGASVCICSEDVGDIWLVPEYTDKDRLELRIDHAATLTAICAAFPGAKVTEFIPEGKKPPTEDGA